MLQWLKTRKTLSQYDFSAPLLRFSKRDAITVGEAMEGIAIMGGTGSGKTTSSGYQISLAMLRNGFGGLVLTVKPDEVERWKKLCKAAGRLSDLIVFDEAEGHAFNFLEYQAMRQSSESGLTENLVSLIEEMMEVANRASGFRTSKGDEAYWVYARREFARNAIDLVLLAKGSVWISHLVEIIREAPRSRDEARRPGFHENNVVGMLIEAAKKRQTSDAAFHDLEQVEEYFITSFAGLAEKTRSVIESSLMGVLDLFCRGKLYHLFSQSTTVTPDAILEGKIIVINLPTKVFGGVGTIAQTIWKAQAQQRIEQRKPHEDRPCFLYIDEAQGFLSVRDMHFAATARASKCVNIWLTQNISNVYVALGGDETGKAATDSILGLAQTKIMHQNADPVTNNWSAELIGRRKLRMRSASIAPPSQNCFTLFGEESQMTASFSEAYEFIVQPSDFVALTKGGRPHGYADAIVFQGGRRWSRTGDSYMRVSIEQGF